MGRMEDAAQAFRAALAIGPRTADAYNRLGVVLFQAATRLWAACFGTGWHTITTEVCERDFGLTVALVVALRAASLLGLGSPVDGDRARSATRPYPKLRA